MDVHCVGVAIIQVDGQYVLARQNGVFLPVSRILHILPDGRRHLAKINIHLPVSGNELSLEAKGPTELAYVDSWFKNYRHHRVDTIGLALHDLLVIKGPLDTVDIRWTEIKLLGSSTRAQPNTVFFVELSATTLTGTAYQTLIRTSQNAGSSIRLAAPEEIRRHRTFDGQLIHDLASIILEPVQTPAS